ncbi:Transmembrane protein 59 [Chamberlinius hualienensis]
MMVAKMYQHWWMWIFVASLYFTIDKVAPETSNLFDRILNEAEPCKESCDKTYPLHTYPNPRHAECCKRGCRFYSLVEFINKSQNENETRDACMASCMEAYSPTGERYACNIGCENQLPFPFPSPSNNQPLNDDDTTEAEWSSSHLLKPFMYVHSVYNNVMDRMLRVISVSWSFYMQQDNGQILLVQSEPEILTEFVDIDDSEDKSKYDELGTANSEMAKLTEGGVNSVDVPVRITVNAYATEEVKSIDWLGCVSKKSGLPRWLLGLVIFVSAIVMVWLCFATTATAPEQHIIKPQGLSIYGDGECLHFEKSGVKIKPYFDDVNDEAAMLPIKVHRPTV